MLLVTKRRRHQTIRIQLYKLMERDNTDHVRQVPKAALIKRPLICLSCFFCKFPLWICVVPQGLVKTPGRPVSGGRTPPLAISGLGSQSAGKPAATLLGALLVSL